MPATKLTRIGIVGLGKMGRPMARHLVNHGFTVTGWDVNPEASKSVDKRVKVAASAAALAGANEFVIVVTAFEEEVGEVLFGADGIAATAAAGTVIGVASTISPAGMKEIGRKLSELGLKALDMPLCRGEPAAESGKLLVIGGGDREAFELCRPALLSFADSVFYLGPLGAGQTGKMVNNLILWACISANYEGLKLGELLGVDRSAMRTMLLESSAQNWPLDSGAGERPMPWAEKDMMIVLQEADELRLSLPLCGVVKEVIKGIKIERNE